MIKKTSVMKRLNKPEIILNSHNHYPQNMNRYLENYQGGVDSFTGNNSRLNNDLQYSSM